MRIKYIKGPIPTVKKYNQFIEEKFPKLLDEENPELLLVAGGDGAMHHAIQNTLNYTTPYLGKALGTFNFLMNNFENDEKIIRGLLNDKIPIETCQTSTINVSLNDVKIGEAVNDVVVGDSIMDYFTFKLNSQDGSFQNFSVKGSGISISTAIGSTALNFNNNGMVLPLESKLWSLTGILCNRYLNDIIKQQEIIIEAPGAGIFLSGAHNDKLRKNQQLKLQKGNTIKIAFLDKNEFIKRRINITNRYRSKKDN
jgi:NAD kinase